MKSIIFPELLQDDKSTTVTVEDEKIYHHIARVFRSKISEEILLLNGSGLTATAKIQEISKKSITLEISKVVKNIDERKYAVAIGVTKRDNFEALVQAAIECNVKVILPCLTEYSSDPFQERILESSNGSARPSERLNKIIESAMIQSNNPFYPIVMPPKSLMDIKSDGHSLLAWLEPTTEKLVSKMENKNFSGILIGPEGGFSKQEHAYIRDNYSFQTISGPIMRADTCVAFGVGFLNGLC